MKNYKKIIVGSLMTALIFASPLATFAEGNNKNENNDRNNKGKQEQSRELKSEKNSKFSSFFNKFNIETGWFNKNKSEIKTNSSLTPSISGISAPTVLKIGEIGTWTVKATDPKNGNLTYSVIWGDETKALSFAKMTTPSFVQNSTFTHSYTTKGNYKVIFMISNEAGLKATSTTTVHVTEVENMIAPVISDLTVTSVKKNEATLNWTTDTKSNTLVWFSTVSPVDTTLKQNNSRKAKVLNHKIEVKKIQPSTKYYVIVGSKNEAGLTKSTEMSFTTLAKINEGNPVITSLSGPTTITVGETETVTIKAYNHENETLSYSVDWNDTNIIARNALSVVERPVFVQTATLSHIYSNAGVYTATFTVKNEEGKTATSTLKITVTPIVVVDTTAPIISNIKTTVSGKDVIVAWTTNEIASSSIYYGTGTPVDTNASTTAVVTDATLVTNHSLSIPSLTASTLYHFILKSADALKNIVVSNESTFTTN